MTTTTSLPLEAGPRDERELEVVFGLIAAAVRHAGGHGPTGGEVTQ